MPSANENSKHTAAVAGNRLQLKYLPAYAFFLLENKLEEYAKEQVRYSREEKVPLLKFFEHLPETELQALAINSTREFLTVLSENKGKEFIERSSSDYVRNRLPSINREQVVAQDITVISFVRRKALRQFLPFYTKDLSLFANVMEDVDRFIAESEAESFNTYLEIQQEKISQINKELEQRQEELLEAQELADMGSFFWDMKDGKSLYTPGVLKIFEMERTSTLDSFMENVHEEDRPKLKSALDKAFTEDGLYECEYRFVKNGKQKKIWSRGRVSFHENAPVAMKGTLMDVTDKNSLVEKLQLSEKLNKQAQAITHIGNWSWEIASNKVTWSDEMYRIYGLEPQSEEINFERFASLIHPDDRENRMTEIQESLQSKHAKDYLMRIVNPDGAIKVLQGKGEVVLDKNNNVTQLVGTCQDITAQHNLNKIIKEKEEYLQQLINNAPDAVIVIDEKGLIALWNPKTEEIFGWKEEEVLGAALSDTIIPPQYREAHKNGMKRLLETGVSHILNKSIEITALHRKGKEFDVSLTISRSIQQGQSLFIAFVRDISKEKETKSELQKKTLQLERLNNSLEFKNSELERINKELESFNYIASHDLQEPLRKIQIFTNRVLENEKKTLPPSSIDSLNKVITSSVRMQTLIEDLLMFSQTVANDTIFEVTDLNSILEDVKSILATSIEEKKVVIHSSKLPMIRVIPFQIQQLFLNLVSNAIKYSKEGSVPIIDISSDFVKGEKINGEEKQHQDQQAPVQKVEKFEAQPFFLPNRFELTVTSCSPGVKHYHENDILIRSFPRSVFRPPSA